MPAISLERPNATLLPGYVAALRTGWSPSNTQDLSQAHLAAIEADAAGFLAQYANPPPAILVHGVPTPRLPGLFAWISDGGFCGFLSFRHQPGTEDLPPSVSGHIGYGVVPWKRGQGIATAALLAALPLAAAAGVRRVLVTAEPGNTASRRVIERAGGVLDPDVPPSDVHGPRVGYWIATDQTAR